MLRGPGAARRRGGGPGSASAAARGWAGPAVVPGSVGIVGVPYLVEPVGSGGAVGRGRVGWARGPVTRRCPAGVEPAVTGMGRASTAPAWARVPATGDRYRGSRSGCPSWGKKGWEFPPEAGLCCRGGGGVGLWWCTAELGREVLKFSTR